jgi:hypothetical protein
VAANMMLTGTIASAVTVSLWLAFLG